MLKSHYFNKDAVSGLAILLGREGFGVYSLGKLFKSVKNNDLGESVADKFAILFGSWKFGKDAATGFTLMLKKYYDEQKIKGLKLLLRNCDKTSANELAQMMGRSFYSNFSENFNEKAAKKLLLLLENFDEEAS